MPKGKKVRQDDKSRESQSLVANTKVDKAMLEALTSEEGAFRPGQMPATLAATEAGQKKLLQALDDDRNNVAKAPKSKRKDDSKPSEEVKPKTPLEWGPKFL